MNNGQNSLRPSESRGDLDYINEINALIPQAENYANRLMRKHKGLPWITMRSPHKEGGDFHYDLWTKYFCQKMKYLTKGIRT